MRASRIHTDECGAVALLMLAATIIIMMLSWIIFDAAVTTQDKVNAQASADSAAFSQAAIKARSMNMMAYSNIAKRSIWAVQSLYPSYLSATYGWIRNTIEENAGACEENPSSDGPDYDSEGKKIPKCDTYLRIKKERLRWIGETCTDLRCQEIGADASDLKQWGLFWHLNGGEQTGGGLPLNGYLDLVEGSENPIKELGRFDPSTFGAKTENSQFLADQRPYLSLAHRYYAQDIRALDSYQRYIYGVTPWWGWVEQMVRAVRNGATVSASWPRPLGYWPMGIDTIVAGILARVSRIWGGSTGGFSALNDGLPVRPARIGTMRRTIASAVIGSKAQIKDYLKGCMSSITSLNLSGCKPDSVKVDPFLFEHILNALIFTIKSTGIISFKDGFENSGTCQGLYSVVPAPLCVHVNALLGDAFEEGLDYTHNSYANIMRNEDHFDDTSQHVAAEPWVMRPSESPEEYRRRTSNIVMTYNARLETFGKDRNKYRVGKDYRSNNFDGLKARLRFWSTSGSVADLARQELTYSASGLWGISRGEFFYTDYDHAPDLWHPSWSARIRPVSLGTEFGEGEFSLNHVYRDVISGFILGSLLGVSGLRDVRQAFVDLAYMDKASMAVDGSTEGGFVK